jgi:hypothetical protein
MLTNTIDLRFLSVIYEHKLIMEYKFSLLRENGTITQYNIAEKLKENTVMAKESLDLLARYNLQKNHKDIDLLNEKLEKVICIEDVVIPIIIEAIDEHKKNIIGLENYKGT